MEKAREPLREQAASMAAGAGDAWPQERVIPVLLFIFLGTERITIPPRHGTSLALANRTARFLPSEEAPKRECRSIVQTNVSARPMLNEDGYCGGGTRNLWPVPAMPLLRWWSRFGSAGSRVGC